MRTDVTIPLTMKHLPKDVRGYPVPYIVFRDKANIPHFTINDQITVFKCLAEDLCAICGCKLHRGRWFVGGPLSAFHENGWYIDTPLHHECMRYALQVCPYMAVKNYAGRIDGKTLDPDKAPEHLVLKDNTMIPARPALFVGIMGVKTIVKRVPHGLYVRPGKPYRHVEFWRDGVQLERIVGQALVDEALNTQPVYATPGKVKSITRGGADVNDRL